MAVSKAVMVVLFCGWGIIADVASEGENCKATFTATEHVQLCHNKTWTSEPSVSCSETSEGLVVDNLVIAPAHHYSDCGRFHNTELLDASCLRTHVENFDRLLYDLLDQVSGRNNANTDLPGPRFRFPEMSEDAEDGKEKHTKEVCGEESDKSDQDCSSFVAFQKTCKQVRADSSENQASEVMNMCSNSSLEGDRLYLSLRPTAHIPLQDFQCRCRIRSVNTLSLRALDLRLQRTSDRQCGPAALKFQNSRQKDIDPAIRCEGLKAYYGFHELWSIEGVQETYLTLSPLSAEHFPTAVWMELKHDWVEGLGSMNVTCERLLLSDDAGDTSRRDGESDADEPENNVGLIVGSAVGGLLLIMLIVLLIFCILRRRRNGQNVLPMCCQCPDRDEDYKTVPIVEPVYSEPGNPRPSTNAPYTFPVDAKLFQRDKVVYAEPDPAGTLTQRPPTPPPLPDSPPPTTPPPNAFPDEPPPKPERTLLREKDKAKAKTQPDEEYDHLGTGPKGRLRPLQDNNNKGGEVKDNVYSHLRQGDYSEMGTNPKEVVKDNVYDTTSS